MIAARGISACQLQQMPGWPCRAWRRVELFGSLAATGIGHGALTRRAVGPGRARARPAFDPEHHQPRHRHHLQPAATGTSGHAPGALCGKRAPAHRRKMPPPPQRHALRHRWMRKGADILSAMRYFSVKGGGASSECRGRGAMARRVARPPPARTSAAAHPPPAAHEAAGAVPAMASPWRRSRVLE